MTDPSSTLRHGKVDGVLSFGHKAWEVREQWYPELPFVLLMHPKPDTDFVACDDYGGVRMAVEHLLALGHRRIGYIVDTRESDLSVLLRIRGYEDALAAAGIERRPDWLRSLDPEHYYFRPRGYGSMRQWLRDKWRETGCTALLAQNDLVAIGAMQALREAGLRVPEDVSLVGFDSGYECESVRPRLTSVHAPLAEIGGAAVELLLRRIAGGASKPQSIVMPMRLDIRESTAPPCG